MKYHKTKTWGKEPVLNLYNPDINYLQVFILDYYGVIVLFEVCDVTEETVKLVELALRPYEDGVMIYNDRRLSKKPLFVKKNVFTKSDYEVVPTEDGLLPIKIDYESPIYAKAIQLGYEIPLIGTFYAEKVEDALNTYWVSGYSPEEREHFC